MTAKKYNMRFYKCYSGCNYATSNKTSYKTHLNSVNHMINNRIKNKNACKRCIDCEEYDGSHLNHHALSPVEASMEEFIDTLLNERLKDFQLDDNQMKQANEYNNDMFSW